MPDTTNPGNEGLTLVYSNNNNAPDEETPVEVDDRVLAARRVGPTLTRTRVFVSREAVLEMGPTPTGHPTFQMTNNDLMQGDYAEYCRARDQNRYHMYVVPQEWMNNYMASRYGDRDSNEDVSVPMIHWDSRDAGHEDAEDASEGPWRVTMDQPAAMVDALTEQLQEWVDGEGNPVPVGHTRPANTKASFTPGEIPAYHE